MNFKTTHLLGAIALLALGGVGHGMWTHRWSPASHNASVDLLATLDQPLGDWRPGAMLPIDPREVPKGTNATARTFVNDKAKKNVTVSLTAGVPGIVAAHTPDVCFLGSGYKLKAPPSKQTVALAEGANATYYVADFEKTSATGVEAVRCRWSWTADGTWQAPDYPRLFFASSQANLPVLYKVYIVHPLEEASEEGDPYREFAAALAAELGRRLK